ncbi:MAG: TonB-dependent receptor [Acidobacteria bacterium]|nr:TonB-dependent receptor [Acidobacteriota bacterium]
MKNTLSLRSSAKFMLSALLLTLFDVVAAFGQETTGSIQGVVTDSSGAAVSGAKVEAGGGNLIRTLTATTNSSGFYVFQTLPPGTYSLTVSAAGFTTAKQEGITLQVGKQLSVDIQLKVGSVSETVVVTSEAPIIDVTQSKVATNISQEFFDKLPKGRNFDSLIALAPGARPETKGGGYQIDGSSGSENVFVIDGVEVTNLQTGVLPRQSQVPFEFLQEIQVKSSGFEAQYGGATGGVINTVVRSGSNEFHGQGSLYWNTDGLNAAPRAALRLNPANDKVADYLFFKKDDFRNLNPGFSLGGPMLKDKLWFFTSYFPTFERTLAARTLRDGSSGIFESRDRTDFLTSKLDYAPFSKLRTSFTYLYSPRRVNGFLPSVAGTDSPSAWADRGFRTPSSSYTFAADYTASSKLVFSVRGGYNYRNYKDYGIPRGVRYRFANSNVGLAGVPANLQGPSGNFTPDNRQTELDQQTRFNVSADVSYVTSLFGQQHNFRGGYQTNRLHNNVNGGTWPDGYIFLYWNQSRTPIGGQPQRGQFGYYINRVFGTIGDVGSNNTSLYVQDSWQATRRLTLNLGFRAEREFVPSFRTDSGIASRAIEFGFGNKLAPRLGFAWDVFGDSKVKVYGGFGMFYDLFKYELPRGSFGGDRWKDFVYTLDDSDFKKINPKNTPGKLIETIDWRIPSNDPSDNTIDPALKPMRERSWDFGVDYALNDKMVLSTRYTHKSLDRTVEDVGILTPAGEKYFIANPGFGLTADPKTWGPGIPVTPKTKRNYDAVEFRADKRFSNSYTFSASYTWSRLFGNYGGLASSDENGRTSPNVNRYFDLPFMSYDSKGQLVEGLLATDRPHTIKFFGSYVLNSKLGETNFAPTVFLFSGTPLTTEVSAFHVPVFVNGRGDLGRTPFYSNFDLLLHHEYKVKENYRLRFEVNFTNLFNQNTITNKHVGFTHVNDNEIQFASEAAFFKGFDVNAKIAEFNKANPTSPIRVDPRFGLASGYQQPRGIRLGVHFFF